MPPDSGSTLVLAPLGELGELEQLGGAGAHLAAGQPEVAAVDPEVLLDGELLVEGVVLRARRRAGPGSPGRRWPGPGRGSAARRRSTGETQPIIRMVRGLAGAVGAEEAERLARAHRDVDAVDGREVAEGLGQALGAQQDVVPSHRRHASEHQRQLLTPVCRRGALVAWAARRAAPAELAGRQRPQAAVAGAGPEVDELGLPRGLAMGAQRNGDVVDVAGMPRGRLCRSRRSTRCAGRRALRPVNARVTTVPSRWVRACTWTWAVPASGQAEEGRAEGRRRSRPATSSSAASAPVIRPPAAMTGREVSGWRTALRGRGPAAARRRCRRGHRGGHRPPSPGRRSRRRRAPRPTRPRRAR